MEYNVSWIGIRELRAAIKRNPQRVLDEARVFITRGLAVYKAGIIRDPWRMGGGGGGSPVSNDPRYKRKYQKLRSGNLRDTHMTKVSSMQGLIGPNTQTAPYAKYVHDGTRRMRGRPWLEYVRDTQRGSIESLYRKMLENIVSDLAK